MIKIDRSSIEPMTKESESAAIVKAIVGLARGLGVDVVAESVEHPSQSTCLQEEGCRKGQGFLFSRAITADETCALLGKRRSDEAAGRKVRSADARLAAE